MWQNVTQACFFFSPSNHKKFWTADDGPVRLIKTPSGSEWSWIFSEIWRVFSASVPSWFRVHEHLAQHKCVQMVMSNTWQRCCQTISPQTMLLLQPSVCWYSPLWGDLRFRHQTRNTVRKVLILCLSSTFNGRNHGSPCMIFYKIKNKL